MVNTKSQPTATRSGLPLVGLPAPIVIAGRDDVRSGSDAGRSGVWAHVSPADARLGDTYPVDTTTDLVDAEAAVSPNSKNPSDIRVTTRGIPV